MDRRKFFGTMIGGIALGAAVRSWPFRVYSFSSGIEPAAPWLPTSHIWRMDGKTYRVNVPEGYELFLAT